MKQAFFMISICLLLACNKNDDPSVDHDNATLSDIFEIFWDKMDKQYVFWDIENLEWDKIYPLYKEKFEQLDIHSPKDVLQAKRYFEEMTSTLNDGHFSINYTALNLSGYYFSPKQVRKQGDPRYLVKNSFYAIDQRYLMAGFQKLKVEFNGNSIEVLCGNISDDTLFIQISSFKLFEVIEGGYSPELGEVFKDFFKKSSKSFVKNIVFDLRNNSGGDLADLNYLFGRFLNKPTTIGYTKYKNLQGNNFTPWLPAYVQNKPTYVGNNAKMLCLVNRHSASTAELAALTIRTISDGGVILGETTFGALTPVGDADVFGTGRFSVGSFLQVEASSCRFKTTNGNEYVDGVTPYILIPEDFEAYAHQKDNQLEAVISYLK